MITNSPLPATLTNPELGLVSALLTVLLDPKAYKAKFDDLIATTDKLNVAKAAAQTERANLEAETKATTGKIETVRKAAEDDVQRRRTQLDIDAAAIKQRADAVEEKTKPLDLREQAIAKREAEVSAREAAFKQHAQAVGGL